MNPRNPTRTDHRLSALVPPGTVPNPITAPSFTVVHRRGRRGKRRRGMSPELLGLVEELRDAGFTWVQIAAVLRERYRLNALVAMRLAHGWSQRDAADAWCALWPDDLKTFKNFSYWEIHPSPTGYAPSLAVLGRLAEVYECALVDLLVDGPNFRHRDRAHVADRLDDGTVQLALGQQCPHGCTVLVYVR